MLLYTIVPPEVIFGESFESEMQDFSVSQTYQLNHNGRNFMVKPLPDGRFQIDRLISTNPQDYLNPDWQPGAIFSTHNMKPAGLS